MAEEFDSIDDAAAAALATIGKQADSKDREYLVAVYQIPNSKKFAFTLPQNEVKGDKSKNKAKATFSVPKDSLRALVHNHPSVGTSKNQAVNNLSQDDVRMAKGLKVPSYIGVNGQLFGWSPDGGQMKRGQGVPTPTLSKIPQALIPPRRPAPIESEDLNRMVQVRARANASRNNNGY